ncbi:hypothetical protein GCM10014715_53870 [Streptomyces spiralis]|uniref:Uncharacterized protein n=1 Tax=Streptomyces spiralis TaxID=66376 RepID=A0A919DY51_9ACTN|nr:hypothetical protein GCM10014715_53870 [Streptomyces spiralis]
MGLSHVHDTDPPCSPRGKWSLEGTKVGPGGLDRAGVTVKANKQMPRGHSRSSRFRRNQSRAGSPDQSLSRSGTPAASGSSRSPETTVSCWVARVRAT